MKFRLPPEQLALPLDYSWSEPGAEPQSHERSKRPRSRLLQARLENNLAMLGRLGTVPGSLPESMDLNYFRQGHRFSLMPLLSTLLTEFNGKRWPHVTALPPLTQGADAQSGESRAPFR